MSAVLPDMDTDDRLLSKAVANANYERVCQSERTFNTLFSGVSRLMDHQTVLDLQWVASRTQEVRHYKGSVLAVANCLGSGEMPDIEAANFTAEANARLLAFIHKE